MNRDHRKLNVQEGAHVLVLGVYRVTAAFPPEEQQGLQAQLRRAAATAAGAMVEGSAHRRKAEYAHALRTALASLVELDYLLDLSLELGFLELREHGRISVLCRGLITALNRLIKGLERAEALEAAQHLKPRD